VTILEVLEVPPSPNVIRRRFRNPHAYRRLRESWELMLKTAPAPHHRKALADQAKKAGKLQVQITMHHSRLYDPDNLVGAQKVVLDALVNIGYLAGDSPDKLLLLPAVQVLSKRSDPKTVVKIGAVADSAS